MTRSYDIGLIGCGHMGAALLRRWLETGLAARALVLDPGGVPDDIADDPRADTAPDAETYLRKAAALDLTVLAVKPQHLASAAAPLAALPADRAVLSIAAGQTLAALAGHTGKRPLIRAMPNTPALIGKGASAYVLSDACTAAHAEMTQSLLEAAGFAAQVADEALMDTVTALSGSGPAYVFALTEAMAASGAAGGLPADLAEQLARHTVIGAAALLDAQDGQSAADLRRAVTSPGGTTEAALNRLTQDGFAKLIDNAITAAATRAKDLSKL